MYTRALTFENVLDDQASYATEKSITLSWRIPSEAVGKELFTYEVQQCVVEEPTSTDPLPDAVTAGKWAAIYNPVTGMGHELGCLHTCSWVVEGLPVARWYLHTHTHRHSHTHTQTLTHTNTYTHTHTHTHTCRVTFRVRVSNCRAYSTWSMPSQPFKVGRMCYSPVGTGVGGDTWTDEELAFFRTLDTPMKIQDYLDTIPMNQEVLLRGFRPKFRV